jgi:hypothetical protein
LFIVSGFLEGGELVRKSLQFCSKGSSRRVSLAVRGRSSRAAAMARIGRNSKRNILKLQKMLARARKGRTRIIELYGEGNLKELAIAEKEISVLEAKLIGEKAIFETSRAPKYKILSSKDVKWRP